MKPKQADIIDKLKFAFFAGSLVILSACVPLEQVQRPSLREVRLGNVQGQAAEDLRLRPGEMSGEIAEINPSRQELQVLTESGRREILSYDINRTRVVYHGLEYGVDSLEAGDRIAFDARARNRSSLDTIRIQEPVQSRTIAGASRTVPTRSRVELVEGTVERVDVNRGVFEVQPRSGDTITISVPYNARTADVDSFRSLRRGDRVRVEGEFVGRDNFQLLSFLSPRGR